MVHILLKRSGFSGKADEMGRRNLSHQWQNGTQRHLLAIRNGVVSTLSLILIGTFLWSLSIYRFLDGMNLLPLIRQRLFYPLG